MGIKKRKLFFKNELLYDIYIFDLSYLVLLGRESELEDIRGVLSDFYIIGRIKIVGVYGIGGVGKIVLVREIIKFFLDIGFFKVVW